MKDTRKILSNDEFDEHVDRCLSMIMHHEEIVQIAAVIKKVYRERNGLAGGLTGE